MFQHIHVSHVPNVLCYWNSPLKHVCTFPHTCHSWMDDDLISKFIGLVSEAFCAMSFAIGPLANDPGISTPKYILN